MFSLKKIQEFLECIFSCTECTNKETIISIYICLKPTHQKLPYVHLQFSFTKFCSVLLQYLQFQRYCRTKFFSAGFWTNQNFPWLKDQLVQREATKKNATRVLQGLDFTHGKYVLLLRTRRMFLWTVVLPFCIHATIATNTNQGYDFQSFGPLGRCFL